MLALACLLLALAFLLLALVLLLLALVLPLSALVPQAEGSSLTRFIPNYGIVSPETIHMSNHPVKSSWHTLYTVPASLRYSRGLISCPRIPVIPAYMHLILTSELAPNLVVLYRTLSHPSWDYILEYLSCIPIFLTPYAVIT